MTSTDSTVTTPPRAEKSLLRLDGPRAEQRLIEHDRRRTRLLEAARFHGRHRIDLTRLTRRERAAVVLARLIGSA